MARISSSKFRLFGSQLNFVRETRQMKLVSDTILPKLGIRPEQGTVPLALRWATHSSFGFPRTPFKVWRRGKKYRSRSLLGNNPGQIENSRIFNLSQGEMYRVVITLTIDPGDEVHIQALDKEYNAILKAAERATVSGTYVIQCPFMKYLRFTGNGTITALRGVIQSELINDKDWELIQHVGFPFQPGAIGLPHYQPDPQGWIGGTPLQAHEAGLIRLTLGSYLFQPIPSLPSGLPDPVWKAPDAALYLNELKDSADSLLELVKECLTNTRDDSADPASRQQGYVASRTVQGLHQPGFPGTVKPADLKIPVVSTALLSAGTDNFASLGLGYGTYDFPGNSQSATTVEGGYDYMVTNVYHICPFDLPTDFSVPVEFAALAEFIPPPDTPVFTSVLGQNKNRPLVRDAQTTETVTVSFNAPDFPQGYAVLKSDPAAKIHILNDQMRLNSDSYTPHIPNIPNPENAGTEPCYITDPESPIPMDKPEVNRYFLAALDIFGRWSGFSQRLYTAMPLPPQRPGLTSLRLKHTEPLPAGSASTIPCTMEIECTWDWTERTPGMIQIGGGFYPADLETSVPAFTDRFAHESGNGVLPLINITFAPDGTPAASGADHDVVEIQASSPGADANIRRYKILIRNVTANFPGPLTNPQPAPAMNPSRVAFAAVARAIEAVRTPPAWSDWVEPVVDKLDDPRPPVMTPLVAQLNWTALPDASNVARGKLEWASSALAAGYVVWEATETALREFLGLAQRPDDPLQDRANELLAELANPANEMNSLKAFVRLNRDLIRDVSYEIALPGAAEVLYIYRVSGISVSNVESSRTNATYFAVPRQNIPGQPLIKLKKHTNGTPAIEVIALNGAGPAPAGFKVYKVRKKLASNVVQMKGLPVLLEDNTAWSAFTQQNLDGTSSTGMKILDPVAAPSWKPYYYQVVAVGEENLTEGLIRGESAGSTTEVIYYPPENPVILLTGNELTASTHFLSVETNIPFDRLEIGHASIEVMSYQSASPGEVPKRGKLFAGPVYSLPVTDTAYSPGSPSLPDLSVGPEIVVHKASQTIFVRLAPEIEKGIIKIVDPLGKSDELLFDIP